MNDALSIQLDLILVPAIAEVIVGEMKDNVRAYRFDALIKLRGILNYYCNRGYMDELVYNIAEKKVAHILSATSKSDFSLILKPRPPKYDGNKFIPGPFSVPEEELICWSETSLKAPLNHSGFKRYSELFKEIFPEKWEAAFGKDGD